MLTQKPSPDAPCMGHIYLHLLIFWKSHTVSSGERRKSHTKRLVRISDSTESDSTHLVDWPNYIHNLLYIVDPFIISTM